MLTLPLAVVAYFRAFFVTHHKLALEVAALRQQLAVFKRKQTRPTLNRLDRLFWIALLRLWSGWTEALIIVKQPHLVSYGARRRNRTDLFPPPCDPSSAHAPGRLPDGESA